MKRSNVGTLIPHRVTSIFAGQERQSLPNLFVALSKTHKMNDLVSVQYSTRQAENLWFPSCLYKQQIKRHVKLNMISTLFQELRLLQSVCLGASRDCIVHRLS